MNAWQAEELSLLLKGPKVGRMRVKAEVDASPFPPKVFATIQGFKPLSQTH